MQKRIDNLHAPAIHGLLTLRLHEWVESPMRLGYIRLDSIVQWLDQNVLKRQNLNDDELYLERACRFAHRLMEVGTSKPSMQVEIELGRPNGRSTQCTYLYELLTIVTAGFSTDRQQLASISNNVNRNVAAESICWRFKIDHSGDLSVWWEMFRFQLSRLEGIPVHTRMLLWHSALLCALMRGGSFLQDVNVRARVLEICKKLAAAALEQRCLFYVNSAKCVGQLLNSKTARLDSNLDFVLTGMKAVTNSFGGASLDPFILAAVAQDAIPD